MFVAGVEYAPMKRFSPLTLGVVCALTLAASVFAQGVASSIINGVVTDSGGGVVPGATVVATSASGTKFEAVTNESGAYSIPALSAGTYSVTISMGGFRQVVVTDVRVQLNIPTTVNAALTLGEFAETVTVTGASAELINTQTATVAATLNADQIAAVPTPTRNVLNAVTYLVGVNSAGDVRDTTNVNGLPQSFLNITMDGVSNQDTFNKTTDGFFSPVRPRQDAVEAVSVTSAAGGADVGGSGAVSINFVTRAGTNRFAGSGYEYFRHQALNTNFWFNEQVGLEKDDVRLNQFGVRQGGPIVIPKLYDGRGKAFFFVHFEQVELPTSGSRSRTVLHPRALDGWYRYNVTVGGVQQVREVNVLDLARANNQISSTDPVIMRTLQAILASPQSTGTLNFASDPLLADYDWLVKGHQREQQPAIRIDYNLGQNHRFWRDLQPLLRESQPGLPQRHRAELPGRAQLRAHACPAADPIVRMAVHARLVAGQRAALRHHPRRADLVRVAREQRGPDLRRHQQPCHRLRRQHRPGQLARDQHAVRAQRLPVHARRDVQLAAWLAQPDVRRERVPEPRLERFGAGRPGHQPALRHQQRSGSRHVHHRDVPRRLGRAAHRCARALRDPHRARRRGHRAGDARPGHASPTPIWATAAARA